jgi:sterol 3beta-glucosyltransferase
MKITIVTLGTRGDVQPYIAVARELMARGHEVKIAITEDHAQLLRTYGVAHHPMRGNFRELLRTDLGRKWLTSGESMRDYARYAKELFAPVIWSGCEDSDAACEGADAVVFYGIAIAGMHAAERRGLPAVALAPWAMVPSREIAPIPALAGAPGFVKKLAGDLVWRVAFSIFNAEHQAYRTSVGLPPFRGGDLIHAVIESGFPCVHLFSEVVIPRPKDWDARHHVAGFAFAPPLPYEPPRALVDFLADGPTPIYIGFGSMTGFEPNELADLATRAARRAGVRAVVATGWTGHEVTASKDVFVVDEIPHDWLFPRVSAVVHHGGVGTLAEGLRAGRPTVIAAFFGDQPFWGWLNEKIGAGPRAIPRKKLDAQKLGDAIRAALDGNYAERAREIGEHIRAENGAARAAELIEQSVKK